MGSRFIGKIKAMLRDSIFFLLLQRNLVSRCRLNSTRSKDLSARHYLGKANVETE